MNSPQGDIGVIGLAVMGANLARNFERNGYNVSLFNRTTAVTDEFMAKFKTERFIETRTLEEFVASLKTPRKMLLMVQAGAPVDAVIAGLMPLLSQGDIVMDGGNSHFTDTIRREADCQKRGINLLGVGISGGEEGALNGPCIMPGGSKEAWQKVAPMLEKIAAKTDRACTAYMGPDGAGHFVKMVHNGIEYGDMQLIAEAYDVLRNGAGVAAEEFAAIFEEWNKGILQSYLTEITAKIFRVRDGDGYLVDKILDSAAQKGTGKWTIEAGVDLGVPVPTLAAAVDARAISAAREVRLKVSASRFNHADRENLPKATLISEVHDALYVGKILSYTQGMALLAQASAKYQWDLNLSEIAEIWKGGCIIRAKILDQIRDAFKGNNKLPLLFIAENIAPEVQRRVQGLRQVVSAAAENCIAAPALATSLTYFDMWGAASLPQNLTQAQRDFFGAHTYQRIDKEGTFHTEWA
jgi:6-phosphogluconate dehydrogenase